MLHSRIPLVIGMLTFAGLCTSNATAQTSINGQIAFNVCEFGPVGFTCDIWVMNSDGSEQRNITDTREVNETDPAWSPDGTRIAYIEGDTGFNRLVVVNADGSGRSVVTPEPSNQRDPTWSSDGTRLAFVRLVPGQIISEQFDILAVNLDGTSEVNLTQSDFDEIEPAWAPDGSRIAFAGVRFENWIDPVTGLPEQARAMGDRDDQSRWLGRADPHRRRAGLRARHASRGGSRPVLVAGQRAPGVHDPERRSVLSAMADRRGAARWHRAHPSVGQSRRERSRA